MIRRALPLMLLALAPAARADFLSEPPADIALRTIGNYFLGTPTYSLADNPTGLASGSDTRANSFTDGGLAFALPRAAAIVSATLTFSIVAAQTTTSSAPTVPLAITASAAPTAAITLASFRAAAGNVGNLLLPANAYPPTPTPFAFDVTNLIANFVATGAAAAFVQFDDLQSQSSVAIAIEPYYDPALRPHLAITYAAVPEPCSVWLCGIGLLALAGRRFAHRLA